MLGGSTGWNGQSDGCTGSHPAPHRTGKVGRRRRLRPPRPEHSSRLRAFIQTRIRDQLRKHLDPGENIWSDLGEIRFDVLAESMGAHGARVSDPDALRPALEQALAADGPSVIHVYVNPVTHLWAPGLAHFKAMNQEPKGR